jgi:hypothetical protein
LFVDLIPLKKRNKFGRELAQLMVDGKDVALSLSLSWGCPDHVRKV